MKIYLFATVLILAIQFRICHSLLQSINRIYCGGNLGGWSKTRKSYQKSKKSAVTLNEKQYLPAFGEFDQIRHSLVMFKKLYGDISIPDKFTVPYDSIWPLELHGFRLGKRLESLLNYPLFQNEFISEFEQLQEVGFNSTEFKLLNDWDMTLLALQKYMHIVGDAAVPVDFIVPPNDPIWPRLLWGWRLGSHVSSIRSFNRYIKDNSSRQLLLDELGFEWEAVGYENRSNTEQRIFRRFCEYLSFRTRPIPNIAVNNANESLFEVVRNEILSKGRFVDKMENVVQLCKCQFNWICSQNRIDEKSNQLIVGLFNSLASYFSHFGSFQILQSFLIPATDEWPILCHNMNLYHLFLQIQTLAAENRLIGISTALKALNVDWKLPPEIEESGANESIFSDLSDKSLPLAFDEPKVPLHPRSKFPLEMTYMFENLRYKEYAAHQIIESKMEKMTINSPLRFQAYFDWTSSPHEVEQLLAFPMEETERRVVEAMGYRFIEFGMFSWEKFIDALRIYKQTYGDANVALTYIISDENKDWECFKSLNISGMPLGQFCQLLRQGDYDGFEIPERKKILDELGFQWGDMKSYLHFRFFPFLYALRIQYQAGGFELSGPPLDFVTDKDYPYFPFWLSNIPLGQWYQIAKLQRPVLEKFYPERIKMLDSLEFQWWWPFPREFIPVAELYYKNRIGTI